MTINAQRLQRIAAGAVVGYFALFAATCWFLDLAFPGKHETQTRVWVTFDAGVVSGFAALLCSFALWRSHRWLAVAGFVACLAWAVWTALPRL